MQDNANIIEQTLALGVGTTPTLTVVEPTPVTPATDLAIEKTLAERDAQARAEASEAGGVLSKIITHGLRNAKATMQRIMGEIPTDTIVHNSKMDWTLNGDDVEVQVGDVMDAPHRMHRHALGQAMARYDVPIRYLDRLTGGASWEKTLALQTLNDHAANKGGRLLLRSYQGQVRGLMSDAYRPIDSRPMLDSLFGALDETGFVVYSGVASDVKVSIRALKPQVYEIHGDPVVFGLEWTNSDYGAGKHEVRVYMLRTLCLNGMTGESIMSNTHLGKRADQDIKLRAQTRSDEEAYFKGLIRDTVTSKAGAAQVEKTIEAVRVAAGERIELGDTLPIALRRALSKPEQDRVRSLFESDESVMLPAAPTVHRLSNVLSWMANTASNPDRSMDLQRLAGTVAGI